MLIQEEAPRPAHPLATLDEDYEQAVLHLAWASRVSTDERPLVFAFVELLPTEIPPPLDDGEQWKDVGDGHTRLHIRRFVMPARRALAWHLDCRRGVALLPSDPSALATGNEKSTTALSLADLGEEPPWPTLVCVSGESDTVPFCPAWHGQPRVHHLIPLAPFGPEKLWPREADRLAATRWLEDRLHFSFEEHPEYWGSIHLVAPNPVFRSLSTRLYPGIPPRESVLARFEPRAGKAVYGLELVHTDKEPWGPLDVRRVTVRSPIIRLDFEREVQGTKEDVFDPKRGLLQSPHAEGHFIKSIQIGFGLVNERIRVEGGTPESTYEVNRTAGSESTVSLGEVPRASSGRVRMSEAHFTRAKRANQSEQLWFSAQRMQAADAVRSRLTFAKNRVLIFDPHFGPDEFITFALAVPRRNVPINILSSAQTLNSQRLIDDRDCALGELLASQVERTGSKRQNPVEVRVLRDESARFNNCYLVVDDQIWLLGSSLNVFGDDASVMVALPNPEPIDEYLQRIWSEAPELTAWLRERAGGDATMLEGV